MYLENTVKHPITFIHGPPETGKTFTGAVIAITLSLTEQGGILVCAPSNVGADLNFLPHSGHTYHPSLVWSREWSLSLVLVTKAFGQRSQLKGRFLNLIHSRQILTVDNVGFPASRSDSSTSHDYRISLMSIFMSALNITLHSNAE